MVLGTVGEKVAAIGDRPPLPLDYPSSRPDPAGALGTAPGTIESQTQKALARLGELLSQDD